MPDGVSMLFFNSGLETLLKNQNGLVVIIDVFYALLKLDQILDHIFRVVQFRDGLTISASRLLEGLHFGVHCSYCLLDRHHFRVQFIESLLDFLPVRVTLLLVRIDKLHHHSPHLLQLTLHHRLHLLGVELSLHLGPYLFHLPHQGLPHLLRLIIDDLVHSGDHE